MVSLSFNRSLPLGIILLCLFALPAGLFAAQNRPKQSLQSGEREKQTAASVEGEAQGPQTIPEAAADGSLAGIEEYEVNTVEGLPAELKIESLQSIAEIVNPFAVRKRGRMYGALYEYHRNDNFDARNFFDPVGEKLPEFKRNQFGGNFGYSFSERLSLFGTYDGLRINKGSTILSHVPTSAMKRGDFGGLGIQLTDPLTGAPFPGNFIPSSRINPVALKMLALLPDPNRSDPDRNFVNNLPSVRDSNTITGRVDYEFGKKSKVFGNYNYNDGNEVRVGSLPSFQTGQSSGHHNVAINYTRTMNPNLVSTLGLRFERRSELELSSDAGRSGLLESLGISGLRTLDDTDEGYPRFDISGYAALGLTHHQSSPRTSFQNNFNLNGGFTWVHNSHKIDFGGEFGLTQFNDHRSGGMRRGEFSFEGYYTGDAFADFLLGLPGNAQRAVGDNRADLRRKRWKLYLKDDWRINSKFNLSLSLAYNFTPFYRSIHDNVSLFWPLVFEPSRQGEIVTAGSERARELGLELKRGQAVYTDRNDWEPRIGLAFSPLGNNRLVIRSSYQIDYDPLDVRRALDYMGQNRPFYSVEKAESPSDQPDINLSTPFESLVPTEQTVRAINPYARNAYVQQWRLSLQNEFSSNWNFELEYEGRRAVHSDMILPANVPLPGSGLIQPRRPNPDFGRFNIVTDGASSIGNSMNARLEKRFADSFSLRSEFRWDRTFGDEPSGDPADPRNLRAEYAPTGRPLRLSLNYLFDLPIGNGELFPMEWAGKLCWLLEDWRISGITTIQSGRYFTPRLSGDLNNDGVSGDRPDRLGPGELPASERSIDQWFAVGDFAEPAPYGFGNSGRNILSDPGESKWDISLIRKAQISEDGNALEFRVQLFNAFNHTNFERPGTTYGDSDFGQIFNARESREIEIAVKYSF